jgi:multidrug efflux pump subunit AcrB
MLVDSGLVVVENIGRHLEAGLPVQNAVVRGVDEVKTPVTASALTTVAAFIPMLFLRGNMGAFILSLPMAVIFALSGSLLVALTVIPLLSYTLWRWMPPRKTESAAGWESRLLVYYTEVAKVALRNRWATILVAFTVFVGSLVLIPALGFQLFPKAEKSFFLINIRLPWSANIATTDLLTSRVEEILAGETEIANFTVNIGKGSPIVYYNVEREWQRASFAQVLVNLEENVSAERYVEGLHSKLRQVVGASIEPKILEQGPVGAAPIQLRVTGPELDTLAAIAAEIRQKIGGIKGVADLRDTLGERAPRLTIDFDDQKAALLGVDGFSFASTVLMALDGQEATRLRSGGGDLPVIVRLNPESVPEVSSLSSMQIPSAVGESVPFSEVASVIESSGYAQIMHWNQQRSVVVMCDVAGRLADEALEEVESALRDYELPDGYALDYAGERQERRESFAGLGEALILALLLIYALLAIQFNSFVQPLVILLTVPFGVTGAVVGLIITGNPFGFMAFIGILSLTGIIINDSIVLTDFANYLQRVEGKRMYQALLEAGQMRLRPVVLTSITTIGGLTPLAIWGGSLWSPLACAVIFGLVGATVLILVILPVIYAILVRAAEGQREHHLWSVLQHRFFGTEDAK